MNKNELTDALAKLETLTFVDTASAFVSHVLRVNARNYLRPLGDDVVLYTSMRNAPSEDEANRLARLVLDYAAEHWTPSTRPLTKITDISFGPSWANSILLFTPPVAQVIEGDAYFLLPRTYAYYLANGCEAAGDENKAEATVRKRTAGFNDLTRTVSPVVFARFQLSDGSKSAKHFAIAKATEIVSLIDRADIKGGTIELENFERAPCRLTAPGQLRGFEVLAEGVTFQARGEATIEYFTRFVTSGAAAAAAGK